MNRFDKTKSSDNFISNNNVTYQDQLNKNKFLRGKNNSLNGINEIPNNRMNILHTKHNHGVPLQSNINVKGIVVIMTLIFFLQ